MVFYDDLIKNEVFILLYSIFKLAFCLSFVLLALGFLL